MPQTSSLALLTLVVVRVTFDRRSSKTVTKGAWPEWTAASGLLRVVIPG
ncbi:hypothetical protein IMZ48_01735 [Candidatus Bathyarchaeota archaeon]|nr:hypothetical protein [Candidatus Bathyarchaeota archaeon]